MRIYLAFAWKRGINKQFLPLFHPQVFYSEWTNANISLELQFPGASGRHCMLSQYCGDTEDKKERNKVPHYIKKIHSHIRLNWWFFPSPFFVECFFWNFCSFMTHQISHSLQCFYWVFYDIEVILRKIEQASYRILKVVYS